MGQLDTSRRPSCELCERDGGILVVRTAQLRVIRAEDAEHPAFYRVIWNDHVAEWTDLVPADRSLLMQTVAKVETVLREALHPTKVNLASLGNVVPHLHWHVIARFDWDGRWPAPVWAPLNHSVPDATERLAMPLDVLDAQVARAVLALGHTLN
ncbi:HIT family protein [Aquabacterium sp.]|jgi:diadenosine tetraphosphate (Ap4A) HIT family hydrolase|uniref:HIT family protein n=1 Tax=Aquabacterium sp. TaxID=1872578 RepID=UPI0025C1FEAF|nr:HIT family protein [Aquabacterium sp.]